MNSSWQVENAKLRNELCEVQHELASVKNAHLAEIAVSMELLAAKRKIKQLEQELFEERTEREKDKAKFERKLLVVRNKNNRKQSDESHILHCQNNHYYYSTTSTAVKDKESSTPTRNYSCHQRLPRYPISRPAAISAPMNNLLTTPLHAHQRKRREEGHHHDGQNSGGKINSLNNNDDTNNKISIVVVGTRSAVDKNGSGASENIGNVGNTIVVERRTSLLMVNTNANREEEEEKDVNQSGLMSVSAITVTTQQEEQDAEEGNNEKENHKKSSHHDKTSRSADDRNGTRCSIQVEDVLLAPSIDEDLFMEGEGEGAQCMTPRKNVFQSIMISEEEDDDNGRDQLLEESYPSHYWNGREGIDGESGTKEEEASLSTILSSSSTKEENGNDDEDDDQEDIIFQKKRGRRKLEVVSPSPIIPSSSAMHTSTHHHHRGESEFLIPKQTTQNNNKKISPPSSLSGSKSLSVSTLSVGPTSTPIANSLSPDPCCCHPVGREKRCVSSKSFSPPRQHYPAMLHTSTSYSSKKPKEEGREEKENGEREKRGDAPSSSFHQSSSLLFGRGNKADDDGQCHKNPKNEEVEEKEVNDEKWKKAKNMLGILTHVQRVASSGDNVEFNRYSLENVPALLSL